VPSNWNWREDGDLDVRGVLRDAVCTQMDRRGYVSYKVQTALDSVFVLSWLKVALGDWN
jgi:hypothetical protein